MMLGVSTLVVVSMLIDRRRSVQHLLLPTIRL
jgi:hypothetical protein